jgi:ABC-2 type transport system permease protein
VASVRVYVEVARRAFARQATYRAAAAAGAFTNTVFGFLLAYVMVAVFAARPSIGGFDAGDAVTFTFVAQGLLVPTGILGGDAEQSERIRTGDVVVDLYRPIDYQGYWAAVDVGRSAYLLIVRGIPPFLAGWLVVDGVHLPPAWWLWPAFLASVALALATCGSFRFLLQTLAFWLLDIRGPTQIATLTSGFFSGAFVPTFLFPPALAAVARWLPFEAMLQWPIEVFLGARTGVYLLTTLAGQAAWAVALALAARRVLARATRRVVIQGG